VTKSKGYATLLLGLAILLASVVAAAAKVRIPAQYRGDWCVIERPDQAREWLRRCSEFPDGTSAIFRWGIHNNTFGTAAHEVQAASEHPGARWAQHASDVPGPGYRSTA
jgi:hypothetical protein